MRQARKHQTNIHKTGKACQNEAPDAEAVNASKIWMSELPYSGFGRPAIVTSFGVRTLSADVANDDDGISNVALRRDEEMFAKRREQAKSATSYLALDANSHPLMTVPESNKAYEETSMIAKVHSSSIHPARSLLE